MITTILKYKYLIIIPLSIFEGPIITVISGFLVAGGFLNIFIIYMIIVLGDILGDTGLYFLGYFGKNIINKYGKYIGVTKKRLEKVEGYYSLNHKKALILSKVFHGIGSAGLVGAGALNLKYSKFFKICFYISLIQAGILLSLGIFFGHLYLQIGKYLNYYASGVSVLVIIIILYSFFKKYFNFKQYFNKKLK